MSNALTLSAMVASLEKFALDNPSLLDKPVRFWCLMHEPAKVTDTLVCDSMVLVRGGLVDDKLEETGIILDSVSVIPNLLTEIG